MECEQRVRPQAARGTALSELHVHTTCLFQTTHLCTRKVLQNAARSASSGGRHSVVQRRCVQSVRHDELGCAGELLWRRTCARRMHVMIASMPCVREEQALRPCLRQLGSANTPDCLQPAGQGRTGEAVPRAERRQRPQVAQARYAILQGLHLWLGPQQTFDGLTSG